MKLLFPFFVCLFCLPQAILAQAPDCNDAQQLLTVSINTDFYGYELSWDLLDANGQTVAQSQATPYANNVNVVEYACVPAGACYTLRINDSYGDGFPSGSFWATLGDQYVEGNGFFNYSKYTPIGCFPGQTCSTAFELFMAL